MNNSIKISVIIPFYNSEAYIEKAILSVTGQTYPYWELIAVNDGSRDSSLNIIEKYSKIDSRIRIITKENGGYATAVNVGLLSLSQDSDYFMVMGSDDELKLDLLFNIVKAIKDASLDVVGFRTIKIHKNNVSFDKYSYFESEVIERNISIWDFYDKHPDLPQLFLTRDTSRLFKTEILRKNQLCYFGRYGIDSDAIFSVLFCCAASSFGCFPIDGYCWNSRDDSVSGSDPSDVKKQDIFDSWTLFFKTIRNNSIDVGKHYLSSYLWRLIKYYEWAIVGGFHRFQSNKRKIRFCRKTIRFYCKSIDLKLDRRTRFMIGGPFIYAIFVKAFRR